MHRRAAYLGASEGFAMSMYAVVNPATGETVKEYDEITDDELRGAAADDSDR